MERYCNFGLEKPLSVQDLMGCCGSLGDGNSESVANVRVLTCEVSEGRGHLCGILRINM